MTLSARRMFGSFGSMPFDPMPNGTPTIPTTPSELADLTDLLETVRDLMDGDQEDEQKAPQCNKVEIIIDQIRVSDSQNDGFFGEPGPYAEWSVDFQVNGKVRNWTSDQVQDGTQFHVGYNIGVNLADPRTSEVKMDISGVETDPTSANDQLPQASARHGKKTNWGIGRSHSIQGDDGTFTYTVDYRIECLYTRTSALSKDKAIRAVRKRLASSGVEPEDMDEDELLTVFMDRARRDGYTLQSTDEGVMYWEGPGSIENVVKEAFPERNGTT